MNGEENYSKQFECSFVNRTHLDFQDIRRFFFFCPSESRCNVQLGGWVEYWIVIIFQG